MRLKDKAELGFLGFVQGCFFAGYSPAWSRRTFDAAGLGYSRDAEGIPVRRGLEDIFGKAVLGFLAREGGLTPRRFVVAGRRREGDLFSPRVLAGWGPLAFSMASVRLFEVLHDVDEERLGGRLPTPDTLGDHLVYLRITAARPMGSVETDYFGDASAGLSPLADLFRFAVGDPAGLTGCLADPASAILLRGLEGRLAAGWVGRTARWVRGPAASRRRWVLAAGAAIDGLRRAAVAADRHECLGALGAYYRRVFMDVMAPEAWIAWAAEVAGEYRKVSDREAWMRDLGGLFAPASALVAEAARVRAEPFVEREEGEKIFLDEYLAGSAGPCERAAALHQAFAGTLN